jgi:hypothetical protein
VRSFAEQNVPNAMARTLGASIGLFMTVGGLVMTFTPLFPIGIPLALIGIGVFVWGMWFFKPPAANG